MKALLWIAVGAVLLSGCSAEERLSRLLAKNPELSRRDTIRDTVRVMVPGVQFDSAIVIYLHDTIRIDTGRLHIRIIRTAADTFFVEGRCDTVFKDVPFEVIVERVVPCPEGYKVMAWWRPTAIIFASLFFILLAVVLGAKVVNGMGQRM